MSNGKCINWERVEDVRPPCVSCLHFKPGTGPVGKCLFSGRGRYDRSKACKHFTDQGAAPVQTCGAMREVQNDQG